MKKIKYVDGYTIRITKEINFGLIDKHRTAGYAPTWFIPKGEWWIDRNVRDETVFLFKVQKVEKNILSTEKNWRVARKKINKKVCDPKNFDLATATQKVYPYKKFTIRMIDGAKVRTGIDAYFTLGGHFKVYDYIPKGEIWVDFKMDPRGYDGTITHEYVELLLMMNKMDYDNAHEYAIIADREVRRQNGIKFPTDEDSVEKIRKGKKTSTIEDFFNIAKSNKI